MITDFMVGLNKALFQLTDPNKLVCFWMSKLRICYGCLFKVDKNCLMLKIDWKGLMVISFGFWLATDIKRIRRIYLSLLLWFQMGDQCFIKLETILAKPFLVTSDLKSLSKTNLSFYILIIMVANPPRRLHNCSLSTCMIHKIANHWSWLTLKQRSFQCQSASAV